MMWCFKKYPIYSRIGMILVLLEFERESRLKKRKKHGKVIF